MCYIRDNIHQYITEPDENGCRRWTRSSNGEGRAHYRDHNGKCKLVTRKLLEIKLGRSLLETELACHTCDNPWCVEVAHLWVGNNSTNMRDKVKKNRQHRPAGVKHGRAKLTEKDIIKIRGDTRYEKDIAVEYSVSKSLVGQIRRGTIWTHV